MSDIININNQVYTAMGMTQGYLLAMGDKYKKVSYDELREVMNPHERCRLEKLLQEEEEVKEALYNLIQEYEKNDEIHKSVAIELGLGEGLNESHEENKAIE